MIDDIFRNNRVCPNPMIWNDLYKMMCEDLNEQKISKPLILAGWNFSSDMEKLIRFKEHLSLIDFKTDNRIKDFILNMKEEDWYHG